MGSVRNHYVSICCIAAALLASCGGSQPPISAPGAIPQTRAIAMNGAKDQLRILPDAHGRDLLYVTGNPSTNIYTYPKAHLVSGLYGVGDTGTCSNAAGDVFITSSSGIAEYPHGRAAPIAVLSDPLGPPVGCAVDPTTGNLAAVAVGGVAVYRAEHHNRWHSPHLYTKNIAQSCSYDSAGNLFVNALTKNRAFLLLELPKGGSAFETITLDKKIAAQGDIQWDGRYLAVGDGIGSNVIHRFAIQGTKGKQIGLLTLSHARHVLQFWIQGNILIGPDATYVGFWRYPQGGAPLKLIKMSAPFGATVSLVRG